MEQELEGSRPQLEKHAEGKPALTWISFHSNELRKAEDRVVNGAEIVERYAAHTC